MATKVLVEMSPAGDAFLLKRTNIETGKVYDAHIEEAERVMDAETVGRVLYADFKAVKSRRVAWLSMLANVFAAATLEGYRGTGDAKNNKVSKEFKAAVRDSETVFLRSLVESKAVKLKAEKDTNPEDAFQAWATALREDKNYSNAKSWVAKYFAFCGKVPVTPSGYLVPVPVMQAAIAEVVGKKEAATVRSMLLDICSFMEKTTIDSSDAIDSLATAKQLVATLQGIVTQYAELATAQRAGVAQAADKVIEQAKAEPALV